MPCIVDYEETIFLIVASYEVCDRKISLNLRQNRLSAIDENGGNVVVISVSKNVPKSFDLRSVNILRVVYDVGQDRMIQSGGVTSGSTAISSHSGCQESKSTKTCL